MTTAYQHASDHRRRARRLRRAGRAHRRAARRGRDRPVHRALPQGGDRRPRRGADRRHRGAAHLPDELDARKADGARRDRQAGQAHRRAEGAASRARCRRPSSRICTCRTSRSGGRARRSRASAASSRWPSKILAQAARSPSRARRWRRRSSTRRRGARRRGGAGGRARHRRRADRRARRGARGACASRRSRRGVRRRRGDRGQGSRRARSSRTTSTFASRPTSIPSHRLLALRRGENEGFLRVALEVDARGGHGSRAPPGDRGAQGDARRASSTPRVADAYERLLKPSIEVDVRLVLKERADAEAIKVFAENLRAPAARAAARRQARAGASIPAIAPAARSRSSTTRATCRRTTSSSRRSRERKVDEAAATLDALCKQHRIEAIAIGNGTAGRETETFVRKLAAGGRLGAVKVVVGQRGGRVGLLGVRGRARGVARRRT